jgi:catechol 2,3-dioxygenase-like lactoylglutathione lyase family enzyme
MFRGIHHTALSTPDFDRALRFYRDVIGLEECTGFDWPVGSHGLDKIVELQEVLNMQDPVVLDWMR